MAAFLVVAVGWILVSRANEHERLRLGAQRIARDQAFRQQVQSRAINTFDERSAQYNEDRQRRLDLEDERIRADRDYRVQREQALKRARDAAAARQQP